MIEVWVLARGADTRRFRPPGLGIRREVPASGPCRWRGAAGSRPPHSFGRLPSSGLVLANSADACSDELTTARASCSQYLPTRSLSSARARQQSLSLTLRVRAGVSKPSIVTIPAAWLGGIKVYLSYQVERPVWVDGSDDIITSHVTEQPPAAQSSNRTSAAGLIPRCTQNIGIGPCHGRIDH